MTPDRRAEIEEVLASMVNEHEFDARYDDERDALRDAVAEIDRLNKVVDQAIEFAGIHLQIDYDDSWILARGSCGVSIDCNPELAELAAELERRSKSV